MLDLKNDAKFGVLLASVFWDMTSRILVGVD